MHYHAFSFFFFNLKREKQKGKERSKHRAGFGVVPQTSQVSKELLGGDRGYVNLQTAIPHSPISRCKFRYCKTRTLVIGTPVKCVHRLFLNLWSLLHEEELEFGVFQIHVIFSKTKFRKLHWLKFSYCL